MVMAFRILIVILYHNLNNLPLLIQINIIIMFRNLILNFNFKINSSSNNNNSSNNKYYNSSNNRIYFK